MTDISKCNGDNCEAKEQCYRYTCRSNWGWQSWIEAPIMRPCEMFIPNSSHEAPSNGIKP